MFGTTWVHVFEEDEAGAQVYRPEDADIPLSRVPRERLRIDADGTARIFVPAPDDRLQERAATWTDRDGTMVIRAKGDREYRVVERSPDRLVLRVA